MYTLAALRLASRAARDDFVDGRCARLRPRLVRDGDVAPPLGAAPRLRRLQSVVVPWLSSQDTCDALAAFLARLPGRGASLLELDLNFKPGTMALPQQPGEGIWGIPGLPHMKAGTMARPQQLGEAIRGLAGLQCLKATVSIRAGALVASVLGALGAAARATPAQLSLVLECPLGGAALAALLPLERVERLELLADAVQGLPQLFEPEAAAALASLRALNVGNFYLPTPAAPAALWTSRLTELKLAGTERSFACLPGALPPRSLPALRALDLALETAAVSPAPLAALLAACDVAALQTLCVSGVRYADVARLAERLPALSFLELGSDPKAWGPDREDAAAAYEALASARLAPLTRLALGLFNGWLLDDDGARLAALLSAPWAASLRALELIGAPLTSGGRLQALAALSQLPHLRALRLMLPELDAGALRQTAAAGWAGVWAPRLVELEAWVFPRMFAPGGDAADELCALLEAPLPRLERLAIAFGCTGPGFEDMLEQRVRALPALKTLTMI